MSEFYTDYEQYSDDMYQLAHEEERREMALAMEHGLLDCGQDDYYEHQEKLSSNNGI